MTAAMTPMDGRAGVAPAAGARAILATDGLGKSFGGLAAVRDVTLALHRGELHAVIGPNGAGKSTLVNLLSGNLRPTAGVVRLDGENVTGATPWALAAKGIGRSYQRTNILPSLTVLENARLGAQARLAGPTRLLQRSAAAGDIVALARRCLDRVGLGGLDRQAGLLSHGEQRQLEIAMALATQPRVLLLDEPLAGMGVEETERMTALLRSLASDHALLLIEHDMDVVFAVADVMTVMVDGRVLAQGRPEEIRTNAAVQNAYLGGHA